MSMTTRKEADAAVRRMEGYGFDGPAVVLIAPLVAWWREQVQPAVPDIPDGCELVVDADGVPVFRAVTVADYGWLEDDGEYGVVGRMSLPYSTVGRMSLPYSTDEFGGQRYIVRQVTAPVPTDVERLAQALAASYWSAWEGLLASTQAHYMEQAQRLLDLGVRCPEHAED